jgi:hypothetical protein
MIRIHDVSTDEIIDREMTADELLIAEELSAQSIADRETAQAKEALKQATLDKLGLTADEMAALLS